MSYTKAFVAGFVSTLTFHQGELAVLFIAGVTRRAPYSLASTAPLGIPAVISLAFWGGVRGLILWFVLHKLHGIAYWAGSVLLGALGPSLAAWFLVMPLHGQSPAGGGDPKVIVSALLLNAAWGLGYAALSS